MGLLMHYILRFIPQEMCELHTGLTNQSQDAAMCVCKCIDHGRSQEVNAQDYIHIQTGLVFTGAI